MLSRVFENIENLFYIYFLLLSLFFFVSSLFLFLLCFLVLFLLCSLFHRRLFHFCFHFRFFCFSFVSSLFLLCFFASSLFLLCSCLLCPLFHVCFIFIPFLFHFWCLCFFFVSSLFSLGFTSSLFFYKRRFDDAIEYYLKSYPVSTQKSSVHSSLGFTYHLKGELDNAIECYHKVCVDCVIVCVFDVSDLNFLFDFVLGSRIKRNRHFHRWFVISCIRFPFVRFRWCVLMCFDVFLMCFDVFWYVLMWFWWLVFDVFWCVLMCLMCFDVFDVEN